MYFKNFILIELWEFAKWFNFLNIFLIDNELANIKVFLSKELFLFIVIFGVLTVIISIIITSLLQSDFYFS